MPGRTFWESICHLAGKEGERSVNFEDAVTGSAVNRGVAEVELKQFQELGLIEQAEDGSIRLTHRGRLSCVDANQSADRLGL